MGERRQRQRVGAQVILAIAITDRQRCTHACADYQVRKILEQESDGEGAVEPRQDRRDRIGRRLAALDFAGDKVRHDLAVSLAQEFAPVGDELVPQRLEIFDDAIVDQRDRSGDVRVGVADRRRAMRRPAGVGNTDIAVERIGIQLAL